MTEYVKHHKNSLLMMIYSIRLACFISGCGGRDSEVSSLIGKYYKAIEENDPDLLYSSVMAEYWIQYIEEGSGEEYGYKSCERIIEQEREDFGGKNDDISISYKIVDTRYPSKEELQSLADNIWDYYAYYIYRDESEMRISDACVANISLEITGSGGKENYTTEKLLIKEKGKWKLVLGYLDDNEFYSD